ncbi:MAG: hypothetical protein GY854_14685 [Deltaproteobacteria bacterium]|nr:hypothetical protein [Deltaproteobacteria bacterium]
MSKGILAALVLVAMTAGCEDNEISFFIEHVKTPPSAPKCEVTKSDSFISAGGLDLAFRTSYSGFYLVANHMMSREDYGTLTAETNGIVIDGVEAYVRDLDGVLAGSTEYYEFEHFVPPEDTGIAFGLMIPSSVVSSLASRYSCLSIGERRNYLRYETNSLGDPIAIQYNSDMGLSLRINDNGDFVDAQGNPYPRYLGMVYSVVRFIGHTNGGREVETPEFTFPIQLCCGCFVDWSLCGNPCSDFCNTPLVYETCQPGMNGGDPLDCRAISHTPGAQWNCFRENDAGVQVDDTCSCDETCTNSLF